MVVYIIVQCSVYTSATGLCPDGVHTVRTSRKNSFNIITVVIQRKARHSKPFTPFSLFLINSIPFFSPNVVIRVKKNIFVTREGLVFEISSREAFGTVVPIYLM